MSTTLNNNLNSKNSNCVKAKVRVAPDSAENLTHSQPTICQRSDAVLKGLDLVMEVHGAPLTIREDLSKQMHSYLDTSVSEEVWLTRAKDALTYFLAKYLKNPLPPMPDQRFMPSGSLRRWLKARCNAYNQKNTHFWYSWFQSKRSTLPLSEDFVSKSYDKHLKTLTKEDPGDPTLINEIMTMPIFDDLLEQISIDLRDAMELDTDWSKSIPSGGASFEKRKADGGQFTHLSLMSKLDSATCKFSQVDYRTSTDLWSMRLYPSLFVDGVLKHNIVGEQRVCTGFEDWNTLRTHIEKERLVDWMHFGQLPYCTIQAIKEPNKIRIISKEQSLLQYINKRLQKKLHNIMKKIPCFRLIGRPFCPTDMIDLSKMAKPTDRWFSVDYSAATDCLSYLYSSQILSRVVQLLPDEEEELANYSFGPHELYYPTLDECGKLSIEHRGTMTNGNLMGGILSFLVLCLANLGLYLRVTEHSQMLWSHRQRLNHVLVNGDDMVYAADISLWEKHIKYGSLVGLEMSIGKSYTHSSYLNLNSTSVRYDLTKIYKNYCDFSFCDSNYQWSKDGYITPEGTLISIKKEDIRSKETPYQVNYLNTGLFYGQHKVQGQSGTSSVEGKPFKAYRIEDYNKYSNLISLKDYEYLVGLGLNGYRHDYHRILTDRDTFWKSRSLDPNRLLSILRKQSVHDNFENLVTSLPKVMEGSLPGKQKVLLAKYLEVNKENLRKETLGLYEQNGKIKIFTRNLFLPISLGGLGITKPNGFKVFITPVQRSVARSCLYKLSQKRTIPLSSQFPLPGYQVQEVENEIKVPWVRSIPEVTIYECRSSSETYPISKEKLFSFSGLRYYSNPSTYVV